MSMYVCMCIYTYVCICIPICTHMGVYILVPFLQAFVFKGSPRCAWCFFISTELLMGKGFACLDTFTVRICGHYRQISQMNVTLTNLAELSFLHKALSLGWLQTYIFLNVTNNRKRKERKERNEESFKQSCFELPAWRCSVPTPHLNVGHVCRWQYELPSVPSPGWWNVLRCQSRAAELT